MTLPTVDLQQANVGSLIELFVMDLTGLGGTVIRWHAGTNEFRGSVWWQGEQYTPLPVEAAGFELSGKGILPRPTMRVANITGVVGALCLAYQDLIGAKVTRKRTLLKYLDAENFVSGQNPTADPNVGFPDEVYFVNRKVAENNIYLEFELASAWDVAGVKLPRRQVIQNLCPWKYRGTECGYTGGPKANIYDQSTSDPDEDQCGKRLSSCKIRFGANSNLPFGGFPGVGMVRTG